MILKEGGNILSNFKYVPVFRFRSQERKALASTSISNKILPLIEIVTEKPTTRSKNDTIDQLIADIGNLNTKVMVDFPMYLKLGNATIKPVLDFLTPILANPKTRYNLLSDQRLVNKSDKIIPVVTYDPNSPYINQYLTSQDTHLRKYYNQIAYRLYPSMFNNAINEISGLVKQGDIVLLDIDEASHSHPINPQMYKTIQSLALQKNISTVLIRSSIPRKLTNVDLDHGKIVKEADNSLLTEYRNLGFSAFGDYCGVKKDELKKGGMISPGYIMYSWNANSYFGFKGVLQQADSFETIVVPSITTSAVWNEFSVTHKTNCNGCCNVSNIQKKLKKGNSQPEWKGFACSHYLYTMEEFL
ncbi:beta family protein [Bacillus sp. B-jedd]|uniref:beta family protein n=1 Tax=Bacillus sp. B-jedd TaxID=1476857 RepID=UPI0005155687|nr:hypothetical protein [Bacillus sp. B-jedd]CEG29818.1 hypothetical protein BN1002_04779 [Bacillus sp. B-jedd]